MKKIIMTIAIVLSAGAAQAQFQKPGFGGHMTMEIKKCLQSARNSDLLNEVNRRMSYTDAQPVTEVGFRNVIVCNSNIIMVSETNLETGEMKTNNFQLGSTSQCLQLKSQFESILSQELMQNKITAVCNSNRLLTFLVNKNKKVTQSTTTDYGSNSQCLDAAQQINSN